jgi:hypothetical protein
VKNILRTALLWLMMLAVPTQGMAAAVMLYCGPGHDGGGARPVTAMHSEGLAARTGHGHASKEASHGHPDHGHSDHGHAAHAAMAGPAAEQPSVDRHHAPGEPSASSASDATCSVCAACCNATALMTQAFALPASAGKLAPLPGGVALPFEFFTDGPRRPPRSFLA